MIFPNNWLTTAFCRNMFNTMKLQRWRYFVDVIPKSIPMHEVDFVLIHTSTKFVFGGPIYNEPAVGQIMTWRRTGGKHYLPQRWTSIYASFDLGECNEIWRFAWWSPIGPFYWHGLTIIPAWISNYIYYEVWDEITYPLWNFNGVNGETVEF